MKVEIRWINSEDVTDENSAQLLAGVHGILVPGGFGDRGIEGKISAIRYARENNKTLIYVTHDMEKADLAARQIIIKDGVICE